MLGVKGIYMCISLVICLRENNEIKFGEDVTVF